MFAYLTVSANNFAALFTSVGEDALVTFGAVWIIFFEEISDDVTNTYAEHILIHTYLWPAKLSQSLVSDKPGHWLA
jgi:hypothetical protein